MKLKSLALLFVFSSISYARLSYQPGLAIEEFKWRVGVGPRPPQLVLKVGEGADRTIVRMPKLIGESFYGACGSFHYNPDSEDWVDAYANPNTGCGFLPLLQDWKVNFCNSSEMGCRISWGDISHRTDKYFSGHQTHTHGFCLDMRPFRKGEFENVPLYYTDPEYDRETTRKFLTLIKNKYGASPVYFNDPVMIKEKLSGYSSGHENHIHFCLQTDSVNRRICQDFQINPSACPFFSSDEMR